MQQLVVWRVGTRSFALPFPNVLRVVRAAAIAPAPKDSPFVCGSVDIQGQLLPVIDLRMRFELPRRSISPADHFILACTPKRALVLWVDTVDGIVLQEDEASIATQDPGVAELADGMLLLQDLERCLFPGNLLSSEAAH
ncbi:MAG: chemotaxis protein CheW [Burkholderiaceae bacterium]|nr:chemotaxis protein CheW [Burkholderiaceae bacterium]